MLERGWDFGYLTRCESDSTSTIRGWMIEGFASWPWWCEGKIRVQRGKIESERIEGEVGVEGQAGKKGKKKKIQFFTFN